MRFLQCTRSCDYSLSSRDRLLHIRCSQDFSIEQYRYSLSDILRCKLCELLRTLVTLLAPFAPHISEELWEALGETGSVCDAPWPTWNEEFLVEDTVKLGVAFNGKTRFDMEFAANADNNNVNGIVLFFFIL